MSDFKHNKLYYQKFLDNKREIRHHRYDEELRLFVGIKNGDMKAIDLGVDMLFSELCGKLSENELRNFKYLYVCSATLSTRFCIEGGMDEEFAYNASDYYIQEMDGCKTTEELKESYRGMLTFFAEEMNKIKNKDIYSKPIVTCINYIYNHLHDKITVDVLSEIVNLNPNYLSTLFKKEVGQTISDYILTKRMEAAKNMLLYSDTSFAEIAYILSFSSQSYFIKQFHKFYGITPVEYRKKYSKVGFERSWEGDQDAPFPSAVYLSEQSMIE